ncbi:MAG: YihY/virulence factor BrkB family protein [Bacteroidales bacterium]|nr:YihY/virulence factor BrkB family protein [Bacteroidales bacterium]
MKKSKTSLGKRISDLWIFVSRDIWRVPKHEVKGLKNRFLNLIRTLILATKGFISDKLTTRASALTYTSLLAVVPIATITIGIARGFGFQKVIESYLTHLLPGQTEALNLLFKFVQSFLEVTQNGVVVGIGFVLLIISVWSILQSIDGAINDVFQIKKARSISSMLTDYLATMFLIPVLLILSSGFSVFMKTAIAQNEILSVLSPVVNILMTFIPYFICWLGFTLLYILIPRTKVKFGNALLAGFIAGFAFQAFQYMYISGQIWVNRYNAIYGSFAAIPLFLLWLQLSWTIVLLGTEVAFAAQNVQNFYFEKETKNVSDRYHYFISILIMNILCKRFEKEEGPMTANEISSQYEIPIRLTNHTIRRLVELHLISETYSINDKDVSAFQPAVDINKLTIGFLFKKMFEHGSEDFKLDTDILYKPHWEALCNLEQTIELKGLDCLIKDL